MCENFLLSWRQITISILLSNVFDLNLSFSSHNCLVAIGNLKNFKKHLGNI